MFAFQVKISLIRYSLFYHGSEKLQLKYFNNGVFFSIIFHNTYKMSVYEERSLSELLSEVIFEPSAASRAAVAADNLPSIDVYAPNIQPLSTVIGVSFCNLIFIIIV